MYASNINNKNSQLMKEFPGRPSYTYREQDGTNVVALVSSRGCGWGSEKGFYGMVEWSSKCMNIKISMNLWSSFALGTITKTKTNTEWT